VQDRAERLSMVLDALAATQTKWDTPVGRNDVSVREGFLLFFERTGQLLDRRPMAGRVGRELRTPIETPVSQLHRLLR
jgi:hypothetical protein